MQRFNSNVFSVFGAILISTFVSTERRITDLGQIQSPYGVPTDFSYNETSPSYSGLRSAPGCPQSIDGFPWIYSGNPPRCYLAGFRGPCRDGRILMLESRNSQLEMCGCECFKNKPLYESLPTSNDRRYTFCAPYSFKEQVWDGERKTCFDLQEQGPCSHSEWLVPDISGSTLICVERCPRDSFYNYRAAQCEIRHIQPQSGGGYGMGFYTGNFVGGNNCPQEQVYSSTLKTCTPPSPDFIFFK